MEAISVMKSRRLDIDMWFGFCNILKNNLVYLHVFVSTQGTQVVLEGLLAEESEERDTEVHDWVEKCGGRVNF